MDSPLLFAIFAFLSVMVIMTGVAYRLYVRPARLLRQLGNPVITNATRGGVMAEPAEPQVSAVVTILTNIGSKMPSSEAEVANLKTDLIRAGFRSLREQKPKKAGVK